MCTTQYKSQGQPCGFPGRELGFQESQFIPAVQFTFFCTPKRAVRCWLIHQQQHPMHWHPSQSAFSSFSSTLASDFGLTILRWKDFAAYTTRLQIYIATPSTSKKGFVELIAGANASPVRPYSFQTHRRKKKRDPHDTLPMRICAKPAGSALQLSRPSQPLPVQPTNCFI